jgi:hypothetical protein
MRGGVLVVWEGRRSCSEGATVGDPDDAPIHEIQQQPLHVAGVGLLARPLQDHSVDGTQFLRLRVGRDPAPAHVVLDLPGDGRAAMTRCRRGGGS